MNKLGNILLVAICLIGLASGSVQSQEQLPEFTGRIVFAYEGDIYVMNADGTERTRLTTAPEMEFDAAWSPDGTRIVYRFHAGNNEEVYIMNADGSEQTNLTNNPATDYSPVFSPDGTQIAFASDRHNRRNLDIWIMNADGSDPTRITDIPGISEYPTWSPDGSQLAFHCTFGRILPEGVGDFEICVVNVDGSELVQVTDAPGESKLPAWSPDGQTIAFASNRHGWTSLPDYVPLGYDEDSFGDFDIYMMNVDGSEQTNLTNNPREDDDMPAWSKDGWIVYSRYACLMVTKPDQPDSVQITPGKLCSDVFPDWWQPAAK
jgi:Tol biopolymer transport system component